MENKFEHILNMRHSCRAFTEKRVEQALLERILSMAQRTASWCNAQPWKSYVLSGLTLDQLKMSLTDHVSKSGTGAPELKAPEIYTNERLARRREAGFALYDALGIASENKAARAEWHLENFRFFGAPHVVVITAAEELHEYGAVDIGAYISTLLLAAESLGVASCPQAAPVFYSAIIREILDIPSEERIVGTVALGYPDSKAPVNSFRTSRATLEDTVKFWD